MKAVQIDRYAKEIRTRLRDIPKPEAGPTEVLVKVKAAAVNPLELLILTGSVRLIQDYPMPLTLGNECSGVVEAVGGTGDRFSGGRPGLLPAAAGRNRRFCGVCGGGPHSPVPHAGGV